MNGNIKPKKSKKAVAWEKSVLDKMKIVWNDRWLNQRAWPAYDSRGEKNGMYGGTRQKTFPCMVINGIIMDIKKYSNHRKIYQRDLFMEDCPKVKKVYENRRKK